MSILILECMPKGDKVREGEILKEFLTLPGEDDGIDVKLKEFANKHDFLKFLSKGSNLDFYDFVHLSGHGSIDGADAAFFDLPKGSVQPFEFPEDIFEDLNVALSACELGKVAFVDPFIEQTSPASVLGPVKEVPFRDACLFWLNYYSLVFHQNHRPKTAYNKTVDYLQGKINGGFRFHETE